MVKNPPANAGDAGDAGLVAGSGRSLGGANGNLLRYSCLENSTDRGDWRLKSMGWQRVGYKLVLTHTHTHTHTHTELVNYGKNSDSKNQTIFSYLMLL